MSCSIDAFNIIASDIGVSRFKGEKDESFCRRTAYSAARFWLLAFCMDDGDFGKKGLTKQAMHRRLKNWVMALDKIQPGISEWFLVDDKGISTVYNRLIDIGDFIPNGFSGCYVTAPPSVLALSKDFSGITGYYDPTSTQTIVCDKDKSSLLLSGLLTLTESDNEAILRPASWWVEEAGYLKWEKLSNFEDVKFADLNVHYWNIKRSDVWIETPVWINDFALAKVDSNGAGSILFIASRIGNRVHLSKISWIQAQELFFYLRREHGNQVVASYTMLADFYAQVHLPIGFMPGHINRILDAIGWPIDNAIDRFNRIVRVEAFPLIEELLSASYIRFERASNGRQ